jgi:hypothetical protein
MSGAYFLHTLEVLADPFKQKTICLRPSSSTLLQTFGVSLGIGFVAQTRNGAS